MSQLLINGGSDTSVWIPSKEFVKKLQCDKFQNISMPGCSFQRVVRSTIEWTAVNGFPKMCIIVIPHITRIELAVSRDNSKLDSGWLQIQNSKYTDVSKIHDHISASKVKTFIDLWQGILPNCRHTYENAFLQIILLSSFFKLNGIDYLIVNGCNDLDQKHLKGWNGFQKYKFIEQDPNVIDLYNFCLDRWCFDRCDDSELKKKQGNDPFNFHPSADCFLKVEKYFIEYIKSCKK